MRYAVWKYETPASPWPLFLTCRGEWSGQLIEAQLFEREEADKLAQEHHGGTHLVRD